MTTATARIARSGHSATKPSKNARARERALAWARRAPLLPALIFLIIVTQLPFVVTLVISFLNWNSLRPDQTGFAGFENYVDSPHRPDLRQAIVTTIILTVSVVLASLVIGLGLALLLDKKFIGRGLATDPADRTVPRGARRRGPDLEACPAQPHLRADQRHPDLDLVPVRQRHAAPAGPPVPGASDGRHRLAGLAVDARS